MEQDAIQKMKKQLKVYKGIKTKAASALVCSLILVSGCSGAVEVQETKVHTESASQAESRMEPENLLRSEIYQSGEQSARDLLSRLTHAIEMQYPEESFSDITHDDLEVSPLLFGGAYLFSGRTSSAGWRYVAGVCKIEENPLDELTCQTGEGIPGFSISQFHDGKILLFEDSAGTEPGLDFLYDTLQNGEEGISYMEKTAERGAVLVPPADQPFLKVPMVKKGKTVTEFVVLTEEAAVSLENGTPGKAGNPYARALTVCRSREEISAFWNGSFAPVTLEMEQLAAEKCEYNAETLSGLQEVRKAVLKTKFYGENRQETIENRDALDELIKLLAKGTYGETRYDRDYSGEMTLVKADGTELVVQLSTTDGGYILGNAVYVDLSKEDTEKLWSLFSKIDGFRRYGDKIQMMMEQQTYVEDSLNLEFTLENHTGEEIHYSLSPVVYKKTADRTDDSGWERMDTIAGVCGTFTPMKEEQIKLSVLWKDAYELKGPGIYRLEIQVMPETDLRFEVSAEFLLQ